MRQIKWSDVAFDRHATDLESLVECDICRVWIALCMVSNSWEDETPRREAYYQQHKKHLDGMNQ